MRRLLNTLYVTNPDAYLRKADDAIAVYVDDRKAMSVPFHLLEGLVLVGHVGCSTSLLAACAVRHISVVLLGEHGQFMARVEGPVSGNVLLRRAQYKRSSCEGECLTIAQRFVCAKIHNSRSLLQHFARDYGEVRAGRTPIIIDALEKKRDAVLKAASLDELRGIEGDAAHLYYSVFGELMRTEENMRFTVRSRRPPRDPVNACLSFLYSMMSRELASACESVGLDPQMGFLHACRPGRQSLALDLVEEFRASYVDRFVLTLFNRRQLTSEDFVREGESCFFSDRAIKSVLKWWQEKKRKRITHPFLQEQIEMGLLPFVQAQLFARYLRGDLDDYPAFLWR